MKSLPKDCFIRMATFKRLAQIVGVTILSFFVGNNFLISESLAAKEATVLVEKAIIYADIDRLHPIGYIVRGKKVMVGEVERSKGQILPIVFAQKVAYISIDDLQLEGGIVNDGKGEARRFKEVAQQANYTGLVALGYEGWVTSLAGDKNSTQTSYNWSGINLKGENISRGRINVSVALGYSVAKQKNTTLNTYLIGIGPGLSVINTKWFRFKLIPRLVIAPHAQYKIEGQFQINSRGVGGEGEAVAEFFVSEHWGIDVIGGYRFLKFLKFDLPDPYQDITPTLSGAYGAANLVYRF